MRLRTKYTQRLPTAPGLRLDIPMFEGSGTKVLDVSGKGNHGTITDAVWTRDVNGVAMSFNGTSAYIDCGNDASLDLTDAITIIIEVKRTAISSNVILVDKSSGGSAGGGYLLYETSGKQITMDMFDGVPPSPTYQSPAVVTTERQHVVFTCTDMSPILTGNAKIYVDGIEKTGTEARYGTSILSNTKKVTIGAYNEGVGWFLNGIVGKVAIYNRALTAEQIKRRYEQTKRDYVRAS